MTTRDTNDSEIREPAVAYDPDPCMPAAGMPATDVASTDIRDAGCGFSPI